MILNNLKRQLSAEISNGVFAIAKSSMKKCYSEITLDGNIATCRYLYNVFLKSGIPDIEKMFNPSEICTVLSYFKEGLYMYKLNNLTYLLIDIKRCTFGNPSESNYTRKILFKITIVGRDHQHFHDKIKDKIYKERNSKDELRIVKGNETINVEHVQWNQIISLEKAAVIDYISNWKNNAEIFNRYKIIHKTGILLYGEPGTGKTTFAKAIASQLKYCIRVVDLTMSVSDLSKITLWGGSVVLFEDIDCVIGNREKDSSSDLLEKQKKLNIVLNMIDGVDNIEDIVFVATTNYINRLDPALIRAGRFNLKINLGRLDYDGAKEMCDLYRINHKILEHVSLPIIPSELQNILIKYKLSRLGTIVK